MSKLKAVAHFLNLCFILHTDTYAWKIIENVTGMYMFYLFNVDTTKNHQK